MSHVKLAQHQRFNELVAQLPLSELFHRNQDANERRVSISLGKNRRLLTVAKSVKTPAAALMSSSGSHPAAVTPCIHHTEGVKQPSSQGEPVRHGADYLVWFGGGGLSRSRNGAPLINV